MEFVGMLFYIMFFGVLGVIPIILVFIVLGIVGIIRMVPDEYISTLKQIIGCVLVFASLILLTTI